MVIAWYILNPDAGNVVMQGDLGATGHDFTYPAIGVTASGRGIMAFTDTGDTTDPSAAYASIDAIVGVGAWNTVPGGGGAAPDDGFTRYKSQVGNPPLTRWGDYGAAHAVASLYSGRQEPTRKGRLSLCIDKAGERAILRTGIAWFARPPSSIQRCSWELPLSIYLSFA